MSQFDNRLSRKEDTPDDSFANYHHPDCLKEKTHYSVKDGFLTLHAKQAHAVFVKWAKIHDFEGDNLPYRSFLAQLQKETYFVEKKPAWLGGKARNCVILDLNLMKEKGLELTAEWEEPEY